MDVAIVTGAAGWLGRGLVSALATREPKTDSCVRATDLPDRLPAQFSMRADPGTKIERVPGDLRIPDDCRGILQGCRGATVFHLAGVIHPGRVRDFYEVNVEATKNLLVAAEEANVRRVVVMSSNSPLGCNPHPDHLFDEDSPYNPYMNYGRSKVLMEQYVRSVQAAGNIEIVIIRAPWFYGPYQPPRQKLFFEMIRDGKAPVIGGGENLRSMAYIDNLVQGLILAATTPEAAGQTYWIADRRPYAMNEIIDTIERLLETEFGQNCAHQRLRLPGLVSSIAWCCDSAVQKLGFYHQKIHVLSEMNKTIACSIEKAQRELAYDPQVELEEGMRRSLAEIYGL